MRKALDVERSTGAPPRTAATKEEDEAIRIPIAAVIAALAIAAPAVAAPIGGLAQRRHMPHHRECFTLRCARHADLAWNRQRERERRKRERELPPLETEASWFDDSGSLACPRVSGNGVANKTLPCGTRVRICNGTRCEIAVVEDRGPYIAGRELDLDPEARDAIGCDTCQVRWGVMR